MDKLENMLNAIEHTLSMYAYGFVLLPGSEIYNEKVAEEFESIIQDSHIYIIGEIPRINIDRIWGDEKYIYFDVDVQKGSAKGVLKFPLPDGYFFVQDKERGAYAENKYGDKRKFPEEQLIIEVNQKLFPMTFKVLYIGQAYGKNGERNALDRLKEHSRLQEIALKGVEDGNKIQIIMVSLNEGTVLNTFINPRAEDQSNENASTRIANGLDMLFDTSEMERVAIYEAALIRYFQPQYNKQLKDSFPSTNLKALQRCYDKDIQAVMAEFCFDEDFPFLLCSEVVQAQQNHMAHFDLHEDEMRQSFFGRITNGE